MDGHAGFGEEEVVIAGVFRIQVKSVQVEFAAEAVGVDHVVAGEGDIGGGVTGADGFYFETFFPCLAEDLGQAGECLGTE
jgi:hypothetical protein